MSMKFYGIVFLSWLILLFLYPWTFKMFFIFAIMVNTALCTIIHTLP